MSELNRIDWNLVPALEALLAEKNVSRAARRLGISQSGASGALARLRRHFDDEILERKGNAYELTPLAQRLVPMVEEITSSTRAVLQSTRVFDPAEGSREFVIGSTEYGQSVIGPDLVDRVERHAPGAKISFAWPVPGVSGPSDWLAGIDGWIAPRDIFTDIPSTGLLTDRWVCVVDADNDAVGDDLSLSEVAAHAWVVPMVPGDLDLPWRRRLLSHGIDLPIAVATQSFSSVPFLVAGSPRIGITQRALVTRLDGALDLRILEIPWEMRPLNFTFWWHPNREHDPAHAWLRGQIEECMTAATREDASGQR